MNVLALIPPFVVSIIGAFAGWGVGIIAGLPLSWSIFGTAYLFVLLLLVVISCTARVA